MGQITIRNSISYQVDYLDLKGLNMDSNKIIKDLTNIQSLTNTTGSSHLSLVADREDHNTLYDGQRYQYMFCDVLYGLIGIPISSFFKTSKLFKSEKSLDTSFLLESIRDKHFSAIKTGKNIYRDEVYEENNINLIQNGYNVFIRTSPKEKKKQINKVIGVVFIHTLIYESELALLLKYMYEVNVLWYIMNDPILKELISHTKEYKKFGFISNPEDGKIDMFYKNELPSYKNEDFQPKVFTFMIPIYEDLDFVQPFTEICSKHTYFQNFSSLNWFLSVTKERHRIPTVDVSTNNKTHKNISVNFTYFPSSLNANYYNKYVEGMTTTSQLNFTKSPILQNCFETIKEEENKIIWSELNKIFCFIIMPENIINTVILNSFSNVLNTSKELNEYITRLIPNFLGSFLRETLFSSCSIKLFSDDYTNTRNDWFKKSVEELKNAISDINTICELSKVKPIVPIELEQSLLLFIHHYFFITLVESNLSGKGNSSFYINSPGSVKEHGTIKIKTEFFNSRFSIKILDLLSIVIRTYTPEEAIKVYIKVYDLLIDYYKEHIIIFMSLDKDVKEIIESYHIGENTPYIDERCRFGNNIYTKDEYEKIRSAFYSPYGSSEYKVSNIYSKVKFFTERRLILKYKHLVKNPKKRSIEYRLFDAILERYNFNYIKSFKIQQNKLGKHDEFFGVLDMLRSPLYTELLEERLPYEEHIKRITTIFETIFNISRII